MTLLVILAAWACLGLAATFGWVLRDRLVKGRELGSAVELLSATVGMSPTLYRDSLHDRGLISPDARHDLERYWDARHSQDQAGNEEEFTWDD